MRTFFFGCLSVSMISVLSVSAFVACGNSGSGSMTTDPGDGGPLEGSIVAEASGDATGEVKPPKPLVATRIGAGTAQACVVRSDATIACWGHNTAYQLGVVDAGGAFSPTPVRATNLGGAVATFATFATSCALLDTAELGCWGSNSGGLLGNLAAPSFTEIPTRVGDLRDVVAATGGEKHACLLRVGGVAFCWGNNDDEQLGSTFPGAGNSGAPARVMDAPQKLKFVGSGPTSSHTCAIREDDQVICWGLNNHTGQLGAPTFDELRSPAPLLVDNVSDATRVATGVDHTCALRKGGTMRCWGANDFGQVGFGTPASLATEKIAKDVPGITDAVAVGLGDQRTCIVHATGKVSCWGNNPNGALGTGSADGGAFSVRPVEVVGITDAEDIALGIGFSCVLRKGGKVSCWGVNDKGQLGAKPNGPGAFSATPVEVTGL